VLKISATFRKCFHAVQAFVEDTAPKVRNNPEDVLGVEKTWMEIVNGEVVVG